MDSRDKSVPSSIDDMFGSLKALLAAIPAYSSSGTRSARAEVRARYEETSKAARVVLLAFLAAWRPETSKSLGEVSRRFEAFSVAGRDLLFAILRFLRR